jgi:hypothetical protein
VVFRPGVSGVVAVAAVAATAQEDAQDSNEELVVGGMLEEDDSQEQELAMLSPLKGSDLRVAKVYSLYYSNVI